MILTIFIVSLIILFVGIIISATAHQRTLRIYKKYLRYHPKTNLTGGELAVLTIKYKNMNSYHVGKVTGYLTDNYSPDNKTVYLSKSNFEGNSISALAVTAHELGHSFQHRDGSKLLAFKYTLAHFLNWTHKLSFPFLIIGAGMFLFYPAGKDLGAILFILPFGFVALSYLFKIITIPNEFNASKRALNHLKDEKILEGKELRYAKKVLNAAALTYVGSLFSKILYYLRVIFKRR